MELIWNSDSTLYFANAAVSRITFDFLQAAARSVEKARRMPFCEESEELMQSTDNEEHKAERGLTCALEPEVQMSNRGMVSIAWKDLDIA